MIKCSSVIVFTFSSTRSQAPITFHVDLPLTFPSAAPVIGLSCLTYVDKSGRPFTRPISLPSVSSTKTSAGSSWGDSLEEIGVHLATTLLKAVPQFLAKATDGSRQTVYFLVSRDSRRRCVACSFVSHHYCSNDVQ